MCIKSWFLNGITGFFCEKKSVIYVKMVTLKIELANFMGYSTKSVPH